MVVVVMADRRFTAPRGRPRHEPPGESFAMIGSAESRYRKMH